jgi:Ca2+-binding RTX toxin-like protein
MRHGAGHARLGVEALEGRELPASLISSTPSILEVDHTSSSQNWRILVERVDSTIFVTEQTYTRSGNALVLQPYASSSHFLPDGCSIHILGGGGDDIIELLSLTPLYAASVHGNGGANELKLIGSDNTWNMTGAFAGTVDGRIVFESIGSLTGGPGDDHFIFVNNAWVSRINGGIGFDTLDYSHLTTRAVADVDHTTGIDLVLGSSASDDVLVASGGYGHTWDITGYNAGRANGIAFRDFEDLKGGPGDDYFIMRVGQGVKGHIDGGAGLDTLNYSLYTTSVSVDLDNHKAKNVGGGVTSFEVVMGGSAGDWLVGDARNNLLVGNGGDDHMKGLGGRDVLIGGEGADSIDGGAGEDLIVAGATYYDIRLRALLTIMTEWGRTDLGYAQRITNLRNGVMITGVASTPDAIVRLVRGTTVSDDMSVDRLTGGRETDWFWAQDRYYLSSPLAPPRDILTDRVSSQFWSEAVN